MVVLVVGLVVLAIGLISEKTSDLFVSCVCVFALATPEQC